MLNILSKIIYFPVPDAIYVLFPFKLLHVHSNRKNKTKIHDILKTVFVLTVADGKINTTIRLKTQMPIGIMLIIVFISRRRRYDYCKIVSYEFLEILL